MFDFITSQLGRVIMIEGTKRRRHKVALVLIILQSLLIGVIIGAVVGIQLFTISLLN